MFLLKSGKNGKMPGKTAVESLVDKRKVSNRNRETKTFHRFSSHFPQKNVETQREPLLLVILEEMSRTTAAISGSLAIMSSILRIELNTVA